VCAKSRNAAIQEMLYSPIGVSVYKWVSERGSRSAAAVVCHLRVSSSSHSEENPLTLPCWKLGIEDGQQIGSDSEK